MLFKSLGYMTSFGNLATIYMLVHHGTIREVGTPHWTIGIGSILFLSLLSTGFFYINNKREGINSLRLYGIIYASLAVMLFTYNAANNLIFGLSFEDFKGNVMMLSFLTIISIVSISAYKEKSDKRIFSILASLLSIISLGLTFGTIYKYIFLQKAFDFGTLFMELFMIFMGSMLFIGTYVYSKK